MTLQDRLEYLLRIARYYATDAEIGGEKDQAEFFADAAEVFGLCLTQASLIQKLEEWTRHLESEIARLSQLAIK